MADKLSYVVKTNRTSVTNDPKKAVDTVIKHVGADKLGASDKKSIGSFVEAPARKAGDSLKVGGASVETVESLD